MKRSHKTSTSGTRNSDYYVKKIKPVDAKGSISITSFFAKKEVDELSMNLDNGENFKKAKELLTFAMELYSA